jgi:hypothetical protein
LICGRCGRKIVEIYWNPLGFAILPCILAAVLQSSKCVSVCLYVCMSVCMYVCIYTYNVNHFSRRGQEGLLLVYISKSNLKQQIMTC